KDKGYSVVSYLDRIEFIQQMEATLKNVLYVMTAIIILLVTLLIMNTLGKIIHDSTKEIGIFRALGAKKKHIVKIFMIEALAMAYCGALIGLAAGWLASIAISFGFLKWIFVETNSYGGTAQPKMPAYFIGFPVYYYLLIISATLALAAITGYARARKASSMRIVNALRDERG
ncbi:MAG: Macrolide export ATP-binding/permease protein, partial [Candidatus Saccharibacteria bacterium GW2011_GWA2_46_10]